MIFQHARFQIWNSNQHPYKHSLDDFAYSNPGLGAQISSIQGALDWLFAVLYPQQKPAVATVGALPAAGNTINDMRVVEDDGDGKSASYRWEQREGEATASWHKIYDVDFGTDSILQAWQIKTQDVYVSRYGYDDRDVNGNVIAGLYAGQNVYGGASANTNLTLFSNSGDGVGVATGYIQLGDNVRPPVDSTVSLGTTANRWLKIWTDAVTIDTVTITSGNYLDTSGAVDFGAANLTTTGSIAAGSITFGAGVFGTLTVTGGSITDTSGAISFNDENLTTTGSFASNVITVTDAGQTLTFDPDSAGNATITATRATISFGAANLLTSGAATAGQVNADNVRLDGNTVSVTNTNGNLTLVANGTGVIDATSALSTIGVTSTGTVSITGQLNADDLRADGSTISTTSGNLNIILDPDGTGKIEFGAGAYPTTDSAEDFGKSGNVWNKLWVDGSIGYGPSEVTVDTLISLRDINVGVASGMTIFYDGAKWVSSLPDSEVDHGTLSGLGDDDHTQYALLLGRTGGQSFTGGVAASNNLTLESTSNVTKGRILLKDTTSPFANASYAAGWSGVDLGGGSNYYNNIYSKGEHFGLRLENFGANPASSSQNPGRVWFNTSDNLLYYDTGLTVQPVGGVVAYTNDTVWNGTDISKSVTVSGVGDARSTQWVLKDNTNNFEQILVTIYSTSATNVTIECAIALPAGTYRLIGVGNA